VNTGGVSPGDFREVLGHLAGGVTVVTTLDAAGAYRGLTATAVISVSLEPPMVLVCIGEESDTHEGISSSGLFVINILEAGDRKLADTFASDDSSKFEGVDISSESGRAPALDRAMAWCEATVVHEVPAGDHTVFIGRVERAMIGEHGDRRPLIHFRGQYAGLVDQEAQDAT